MQRHTWIIGLAAAVLAGASALPAAGQSCDDFDPCTVQDMCSDGICMGSSGNVGASCDDFNDCTVNDRCTALGCMGDSAPLNTPCASGCGTCQSLVPFPVPGIPLQCTGNAADHGKSCDLGGGACLESTCQIFSTTPGLPALAFCIPQLKECPDTDGNPCTDNCNFATGNCERNAPKCLPTCQTCNPSSGACVPTNENVACDDFNECTAASRCEEGFCVAGQPSGPTPTATQVQGPTPTATRPPVGACIGDCNEDGVVAINELITGVNIALGNAAVGSCESFDLNGDDTVAVNELISGVNALLNGCAG